MRASTFGHLRRACCPANAACLSCQDELPHHLERALGLVEPGDMAAAFEALETDEVRGQGLGDRFGKLDRHDRIAVTGPGPSATRPEPSTSKNSLTPLTWMNMRNP